MAKLPSFFSLCHPITTADRKWYDGHCTGWTRLHSQLPNLTERQLLVVVVLELEGDKRPEIIGRCLRRFNRVRMARELRELWSIVPKAGVRGRALA